MEAAWDPAGEPRPRRMRGRAEVPRTDELNRVFFGGASTVFALQATERMEPGVTFLTGFFDNDHAMLLVDHEGNELHRWTVNLFETFPSLAHVQPAESRPRDNWQTHLHGAYPLSDGLRQPGQQ